MRYTNTVIIGGGQAGLAMSRCLSERSVTHVVLERGRVGERWRSERWDSLQLLTPNWMSRLPGHHYQGADPDGFMSMPEVVNYLEDYATSIDAPVLTGTTVSAVEACDGGFRVLTDRGAWQAVNVVIATGACDTPAIPAMSEDLDEGIVQLAPTAYRNPEQLPKGGVLIVGASASGVQLADEIHSSGRPVTLAVGRHIRLPRQYRGHDILWWLDRMGILDESAEDVFSVEASRNQPSLQLVGRSDRRSLDLPTLAARGVTLVGRAVAADGHQMHFADDLATTTTAADAKLQRILRRIDQYIAAAMAHESLPAPDNVPALRTSDVATCIDLRAAEIRTVIWATGFRRSYPWLKVPVLDDRGEIRHQGGVTPVAGLYVLGLQFLRRRKSSFIDGAGADAAALSDHIVNRHTTASFAA